MPRSAGCERLRPGPYRSLYASVRAFSFCCHGLFKKRFGSDDVEVVISDLLVATADSSDTLLDDSITLVLQRLRESLRIDVVFVSEFVEGQRVFRFVDSNGSAPMAPGDSSPLEQGYCKLVVDGRMPEFVKDVAKLLATVGLPATSVSVGAHLSTPIVLTDGQAYGTLCCFSAAPNEALRPRDLTALRHTEIMAPDWALEPIDPVRR